MIKKLLKYFLKTLLFVVGFIVLYGVLCLLLPLIPISAEKTTEPKTITIYLLSNGMHTDLVLPTENEYINWTTKVSPDDTKGKKRGDWLAFGWGDKGFYLNTPTWADLKFSTAVKAAFWMSDSAMHTTYLGGTEGYEKVAQLSLTAAQYKRLVSYIDQQFDKDAQGKYIPIPTNAVYGTTDAFYEAHGHYQLFFTCNSWTNKMLKNSGIRSCVWTPFASGVMRNYQNKNN